jgi:uncharacterized protein YgbK (DUF1537 family)
MHLAKQTRKSIGLIDVLWLEGDDGGVADAGSEVVLIDVLLERHLPMVGRLIDASPFVVGSSGVESALMAHRGVEAKPFPAVKSAGPILAVCGSCSPVTAAQMEWAVTHEFANISFRREDAAYNVSFALRSGKSVMLNTRGAKPGDEIGQRLGRIAREVLAEAKIRRLLVAGGDTSGEVARALGIESLEMIGELTRGAPLCRATAPNSPADGIEVTFKGGQIGPVDFFGLVRDGMR